MSQNVFIIQSPLNNDIVADPYNINLWTNDQKITWKILAPDTVWSLIQIPPIVFNEDWINAGGRTPEQEIGPGGEVLWTVQGPGPLITGANEFTYSYTFYVNKGGNEIHGGRHRQSETSEEIIVDPDVSNQPQP
jgi:hypothetical protein